VLASFALLILKLPITNLLLLGYHSDQRLTSLIASKKLKLQLTGSKILIWPQESVLDQTLFVVLDKRIL
jgi:hypothetical protein